MKIELIVRREIGAAYRTQADEERQLVLACKRRYQLSELSRDAATVTSCACSAVFHPD